MYGQIFNQASHFGFDIVRRVAAVGVLGVARPGGGIFDLESAAPRHVA